MNQLIQTNIPLHDKNWFRTGGAAEFYAAPQTAEEFRAAVIWAQEHAQPITLLGQGANVLISDAGCPGLVIQPQVQTIEHTLQYSHACFDSAQHERNPLILQQQARPGLFWCRKDQ